MSEKPGWEERFDKYYPGGIRCNDPKCPEQEKDHSPGMKDFIRAEIEAAEKRGAREVLRYILRPKSGLEDASNADIVFDRATEKYLEINSDAKAADEEG